MNEIALFLTLSAVFLQGSACTVPPIVTGEATNSTTGDIGLEIDRKDLRPMMASAEPTCPPGFRYLANARSCFLLLSDAKRSWSSASQKCRDLSYGAHLAVITSRWENEAITAFLETMLSKYPHNKACTDNRFWIGGQRIRVGDCSSPSVWKLPNGDQVTMQYTNWGPGEPNCAFDVESCVHIYDFKLISQYVWNYLNCDWQECALCEYNPPTV